MINKLISEGETLKSEVQKDSDGKKYFTSAKFESWVIESILCLEKKHKGLVITEQIQERYRKLTQSPNYKFNYSFYQILLESLIAAKKIEDDEVESFKH